MLVTTTTHMYVEADTDLSCDFFSLRDKIIKDGYCMAGQKISEQSKPKMCGLPYDLLDRLIKDMPQLRLCTRRTAHCERHCSRGL